MDLERRVKALEDELKILKNQIQNTLLDIQGQLGAMEASGERAAAKTGIQAKINLDSDEDPDEAQPKPLVEIPKPSGRISVAADNRPLEPIPAVLSPARPEDLATFARVLTWVRATAVRVGSSSVRQALGLAVSSGQLPHVIQNGLVAVLPPDSGQSPDIGQVLPVYLELNALLSPYPQEGNPVTVMEASNHG